MVKELSNDKNQYIYPVSIKKDELPDKFAEFFDQKIDNIRKNIAEQNTPPLSQHHNSDGRVRETGPLLKEFKQLNMNELQDLFKKMNKKFYPNDPIPIKVFASCFSDSAVLSSKL